MKSKTGLWLAACVFLVAALIDLADGDLPKLVTSACLAGAFTCYAIGRGRRHERSFRIIACILFVVAAFALVYRLLKHYMVI